MARRSASATARERSLSAAKRHMVEAKNTTANQAVGIKTKSTVTPAKRSGASTVFATSVRG